MKRAAILVLFALLAVTHETHARLVVGYRAKLQELQISFSSRVNCRYSLKAAPEAAPGRASTLARGITTSRRTAFRASPVSGLRGGSARRIRVSLATVCSGRRSSETARLRMPVSEGGPSSLGEWSQSVASAFNQGSVRLQDVFPGVTFSNPIGLENAADGTGRLFIIEQDGRIFSLDRGGIKSLFLDIAPRVLSGGERGLLGLAFHPQFESNGLFFINYTRRPDGATVIARYTSNGSTADPASEAIFLTVAQPYPNHNGGQLSFGPDGYLYIALGDGGSSGDPHNNAQSLNTLLGKILRIDVDHRGGTLPYSNPPDNPFVNGSLGERGEIFAYGLRNPWRFSFDPLTGRLWAGDVGQDAIEEVDIIEKGKNYGWDVMEGSRCYPPGTSCSTSGFVLPVAEYGREDGIAIIGGYVYRGRAVPSLAGKYLYADFQSGKVWELSYDGGRAANRLLITSNKTVSAFGVDEAGELYLVSYVDGRLLKFVGP